MVKNIILVIILLSSVLMPLAAAEEQENEDANIQMNELSIVVVPCNADEDTLGCAYRVMLEKGILENPKTISELRRGLKMPTRLYL